MSHILVVDDEEPILRLLSRTLEIEGFSVSTARDRDEGLRQMRREWPSVVVMDLMMPGMTARDFMKKVREEGEVPVLVLSASDAALEIAALLGADDSLEKPFDCDELVERVKRLESRVA